MMPQDTPGRIVPAQEESCAIAILDLPLGSALTCDGQTILLQRDDFVGIQRIPSSNRHAFHLVIARAGSCGSKEEQKQGNVAAVSVGFVFQTHPAPDAQQGTSLALVRQFDPTTEEVSSQLVDTMTISNLIASIINGGMEPQRMISYKDVVSAEQSMAWSNLTSFVSERLLVARGIKNGSKIVPGSYGEDSKMPDNAPVPAVEDGSSVAYPAIPVLDSRKSARHSRHEGTKRFLATLPPSDRTSLFLHENPHNFVMEIILKRFGCRWEDLLGDIQLSYVLFLHLRCLSSLEHWRDLVAMLSNVDDDCIEMNSDLYCNLLQTLGRQVTTIEEDFFEDIEMSGDNFFVPALKRLCRTTSQIDDEELQAARTTLCRILENRFRDAFQNIDEHPGGQALASSMEIEKPAGPTTDGTYVDGAEDDENTPVVVSNEEIEASAVRSSQRTHFNKSSSTTTTTTTIMTEQYAPTVRRKYPVLFAAKMEHEDILMTCARALDDATDVSLVREAGTFLVEEVEPDTTMDQ